MKKIDCFGDICPIPMLKMQNELTHTAPGETFQMVVDHSCVIESIREYLSKSPFSYEIEEVINGVWEITITKTP
ncbi:MAG: tRNA 2-thiouridine synthesizing protein [Clostridiales bacterium]|jgi:TusA-related sulfurtransferase|nr:tRNA 2-thiouridine synthesizing protein [Clostridiales bacterium]